MSASALSYGAWSEPTERQPSQRTAVPAGAPPASDRSAGATTLMSESAASQWLADLGAVVAAGEVVEEEEGGAGTELSGSSGVRLSVQDSDDSDGSDGSSDGGGGGASDGGGDESGSERDAVRSAASTGDSDGRGAAGAGRTRGRPAAIPALNIGQLTAQRREEPSRTLAQRRFISRYAQRPLPPPSSTQADRAGAAPLPLQRPQPPPPPPPPPLASADETGQYRRPALSRLRRHSVAASASPRGPVTPIKPAARAATGNDGGGGEGSGHVGATGDEAGGAGSGGAPAVRWWVSGSSAAAAPLLLRHGSAPAMPSSGTAPAQPAGVAREAAAAVSAARAGGSDRSSSRSSLSREDESSDSDVTPVFPWARRLGRAATRRGPRPAPRTAAIARLWLEAARHSLRSRQPVHGRTSDAPQPLPQPPSPLKHSLQRRAATAEPAAAAGRNRRGEARVAPHILLAAGHAADAAAARAAAWAAAHISPSRAVGAAAAPDEPAASAADGAARAGPRSPDAHATATAAAEAAATAAAATTTAAAAATTAAAVAAAAAAAHAGSATDIEAASAPIAHLVHARDIDDDPWEMGVYDIAPSPALPPATPHALSAAPTESATERSLMLPLPTSAREQVVRAVADWDGDAAAGELSLRVGTLVRVQQEHSSGWWQGCVVGKDTTAMHGGVAPLGAAGWFPCTYVEWRSPSSANEHAAEAAAASVPD